MSVDLEVSRIYRHLAATPKLSAFPNDGDAVRRKTLKSTDTVTNKQQQK